MCPSKTISNITNTTLLNYLLTKCPDRLCNTAWCPNTFTVQCSNQEDIRRGWLKSTHYMWGTLDVITKIHPSYQGETKDILIWEDLISSREYFTPNVASYFYLSADLDYLQWKCQELTQNFISLLEPAVWVATTPSPPLPSPTLPQEVREGRVGNCIKSHVSLYNGHFLINILKELLWLT